MKPQKHFRITAFAVMVMGIIHVCATPVILPAFKVLMHEELLSFLFMFVSTGLALIFAGWIQYFILKRWNYERTFFLLLKGSVLFISVSGIGAVVTMWSNPFAYITLLIALYELYLLKLLRIST
jgi:hypothetical protein